MIYGKRRGVCPALPKQTPRLSLPSQNQKTRLAAQLPSSTNRRRSWRHRSLSTSGTTGASKVQQARAQAAQKPRHEPKQGTCSCRLRRSSHRRTHSWRLRPGPEPHPGAHQEGHGPPDYTHRQSDTFRPDPVHTGRHRFFLRRTGPRSSHKPAVPTGIQSGSVQHLAKRPHRNAPRPQPCARLQHRDRPAAGNSAYIWHATRRHSHRKRANRSAKQAPALPNKS